jgi:hypothetical protein
MKTLKQLIQEHKEIMLQLEEENIKRIIKEWLTQKRQEYTDSNYTTTIDWLFNELEE